MSQDQNSVLKKIVFGTTLVGAFMYGHIKSAEIVKKQTELKKIPGVICEFFSLESKLEDAKKNNFDSCENIATNMNRYGILMRNNYVKTKYTEINKLQQDKNFYSSIQLTAGLVGLVVFFNYLTSTETRKKDRKYIV